MSPLKSKVRRALIAHDSRRSRYVAEAVEQRLLLSTYTVNTFADVSDPVGSTTISVRDAITMAAENPGDDTINIPAGTYPLSLGELLINDSSGKVTFQSRGGMAIFDGLGQSLDFEIRAGSTVTMDGLGMRND